MDKIINITNKLSSYSELTEKMQTLKRKCDALCCREADIITILQQEESSCTKKRRKEVENWLENVASTRNRVENIELQVSRSGTLSGGLLGRKQLVDGVDNLTKEVTEYMEQGLFPQGLSLDAHEDVALLTAELVGKAFERNLETIWEHLRKEDVLIIGVWGMGGVGKTTLVKHIHNRILEHRDTFNQVYWITVSQNPSIRKLQDDIAREIRFDISTEENESRRAAILSRELNKRKRSVLILDDLWNDICLESVGVATAVNGCKLLITTRSLDVSRRLCCQETIKIEPLLKEEAWYLFEKTLIRHSKMVLSAEVLEVAKCVAQQCAGLPLGINTLASSMRDVNDVCEWRNVLRSLKESEVVLMGTEIEEKVFKVLELSYNRLYDPIVQQCFLYCALYPEDHIINREELIQHLIDERLIGTERDRQAQFDRGHAILNKLIGYCLLEDAGYSTLQDHKIEYMKMHDLVRDMAIKMKSLRLMVKAGMQLEEIPEEHEWSKDVERVSLMDNEIEEITSKTSPKCPKLLTLFLSGNPLSKGIENSFFEHMPTLQVLNLSHCKKIEELPNSVSNLKNLSALVLSFCSKLQHIPSLAELSSLKRLDLRCSGIREIPHGVEMLVNLTYLDLSTTLNLKVFPCGILPKLSRLECLKLENDGSVKIKGEELKGLERLRTFQGFLVFDDKLNGFKEYVMSRRKYVGTNYCRYEFCFDDGNKYVSERYNDQYKLNEVELKNWSVGGIRREEYGNVGTVEALLKDFQSLVIDDCKTAGSLSEVRWVDNATQDLKICCLSECSGIECVGLFSNPSSSSPLFFQTLEILQLSRLRNLCNLFEMEGEGEGGGPILPPSLPVAVFSSLKTLYISHCHYIKKLFQPGFFPNLQNLEQIRVYKCDGFEEIIASTTTKEEEERNSMSSSSNKGLMLVVQYSLPKLKTLTLNELPRLKSICEGTLACDALQFIDVHACPRLRRIPLSQPPASLKSVKVSLRKGKKWWESLEWDDPDAKNLFQPYLMYDNYED